ncbi:hypothetical protein BC834DRAFT_972946 [Gloeopeniophorella convolvens]|nr:hypothetical protein BC834DRAFT_972946 [Gloeopeniophorella convolvens]
MAAPTQQLPSWLSRSTSTATNAEGQPTATFTTIVNLPLTYFGPPIPLGTDGVWVYGGLSSPAPSPSTTSESTAIPSTSAIPSSTSAPLSSTSLTSPTSTPISSSTSASSSIPSSSVPPSSTTSTPPVSGGSSSHSHHTGLIIGAVLGSVLGSLLLLFLVICCMRKRPGPQWQRENPSEPPMGQVMWMWHDVERPDDDREADLGTELRSPGEGSPRGSGDEHDPFLRPSSDAPGAKEGEPSARLVDAPPASRDSTGPIGIALTAGTGTASTRPWGFKSTPTSTSNVTERHIISRDQLSEMYPRSPQSPGFPGSPEDTEPGPDAPLLPPPTVNANISHGSRKSLMPSERSMTPGNDPESARLYTAQRVHVGRSPQASSSGSHSPWPEAIGIPSILRRSWLNPRTRPTTPSSVSPQSSFASRPLTDNELEAGRSLTPLRTEMGYRDGLRPISGVSGLSTGSGRSGNTVFFDAQSGEDLAQSPPPVPPLPQGTASTGRSGVSGPSPLSAQPIRASSESDHPPAYEPIPSNASKAEEAIDFLDMPVPRPASPFASVSSTSTSNKLPPPPGLGLPVPHVWRDSASDPSDVSGAINIEFLEDAPPEAGEGWRQIAQALPGPEERRTTFGMQPLTVVHPREPTTSEQGSLHSMRSHLSPRSALSASGSAPASSEHSRGPTGSSGKSLAHSSSVSSYDRRFVRSDPGEVSPPLSAIGRSTMLPPPPRALTSTSPVRGLGSPTSPPLAPQLMPSATITSTTTRSSVTTHTSVTDPITGEVSRFPHVAWTGGRESPDQNVPPSSWGGSWGSPGHLRALQNRVGGRDNASHA